ncbi:MAG: hypothetical protein RIG77_19735 [Cyclobacteriaceae bacterium]
MDIATKYKMISKIIDSKDEDVLNSVKSLLGVDDELDFWEELKENDRMAIDDGLSQLDKGQYVSHDSVRTEIKKRFNF